MSFKKKTIKYIFNHSDDCIYTIKENPFFKNMTLTQILRNLDFSDNDDIEILYEEDVENREKLEKIYENLGIEM